MQSDHHSQPTGTEAGVCADIARRQELGIQKYGTSVAENPASLREWMQHSYEEKLDDAVYMKRQIEKLDEIMRGISDAREASMKLCWQIEKSGASEELTEASIRASLLHDMLNDLLP
jgi:predicted Holliday junction resolvase-like endonuclease